MKNRYNLFVILSSILTCIPLHATLPTSQAQLLEGLDRLIAVQEYCDYEKARHETVLGKVKHKLDTWWLRSCFNNETYEQDKKNRTAQIAYLATLLKEQQARNPFLALPQQELTILSPSLVERHSLMLYSAMMFSLAYIACTLHDPSATALSTSTNALIEQWKNGVHSLKILCGLEEDPWKLSLEQLEESKKEFIDTAFNFLNLNPNSSWDETHREELYSNPETRNSVRQWIKATKEYRWTEKESPHDAKTILAHDIETLHKLAEALEQNTAEFRTAMSDLQHIDGLALGAKDLKKIRDGIEERLQAHIKKNKNAPPSKSLKEWVASPLTNQISNQIIPQAKEELLHGLDSLISSIPPHKIKRNRAILDAFIAATIARADHLALTMQAYQNIATRVGGYASLFVAELALDGATILENSIPFIKKADRAGYIFEALFPIALISAGIFGLKKGWNFFVADQKNYIQKIMGNIITLVHINGVQKLTEAQEGLLIFWTIKLKQTQSSMRLTTENRQKINTFIAILEDTTSPAEKQIRINALHFD